MDRQTYNLLTERVAHLELLIGKKPVLERLLRLKLELQTFLNNYSVAHPLLDINMIFHLQRRYDNNSHYANLESSDTNNPNQLDSLAKKAYIISNYEYAHELITAINDLFKFDFDYIIDSKFPADIVEQRHKLSQVNKVLHDSLNSEFCSLLLQSLSFAENYIEICLYFNKHINCLQKSLLMHHKDDGL